MGWEAGSYVAFLPMGLTLIIPLRNSTKVPLATVSKGPWSEGSRWGAVPFNGDIQIRNVTQYEVHKRLILVFADMLDKRLRRELFSQFVGSQPVLRKRVIEFIGNCKEEAEAMRSNWDVETDQGCHRWLIVQRSLRNLSHPRTQWRLSFAARTGARASQETHPTSQR